LDMKIRITACIIAALLVLTNASVWEGAASIAPGGDLPDEGYYAATNSFPRNTVVDITNLETGKSIRVIVASGLDAPGLLAILSREAAGAIGLRPRIIGRIRMTQPSDPVAFSRFTEGLASSGDPDYDPRALVAADPSASALLNDPGTSPESPAAPPLSPPPGLAAVSPEPASDSEPVIEDMGDAGYYDEIVDIPGFYNPPAALAEDEGIDREPDAAWVYEYETEELAGETSEPEEMPEEWWIAEAEEAPEALELPDPLEIISAGEDETPETSQAPGWESEAGLSIADEPDVSEPEHESPGETSYDYSLVPAEERPPEEYPDYMLPPEAEISVLPSEEKLRTDIPDESFFIPPVAKAAPVPEYREPEVLPPPSIFSVPVIHNLEQGKYYLQVGAFSRPEAAESELLKIGNTYPLSIQNGGSNEKPVYRILVGPVNLGESGALLQRFKSIGYNDAFVRSER
jgi:cell division protein FtsN